MMMMNSNDKYNVHNSVLFTLLSEENHPKNMSCAHQKTQSQCNINPYEPTRDLGNNFWSLPS